MKVAIKKLSKARQLQLRCFSSAPTTSGSSKIEHVPSMKEFLQAEQEQTIQEEEMVGGQHMEEYFKQRQANQDKSYFIETHGCQMNVADTEIVASVLQNAGYQAADDLQTADIILVNTCAIRENAEQKIWNRLRSKYGVVKKKRPDVKIGVLGCMAERIKEKMLEHKEVDLVAGPDAYRDLPRLLSLLDLDGEESEKGAMNV